MQLIRSSSPYWRLAISNAAVDASKREEKTLPINIQNKLASLKVQYPEQTGANLPMPLATIVFKGLTLTEVDGENFDETKLFHIYMGWYDFFGLSAKAYKVAWGSIAKADVSYEKAGYALTLTLKPYGANFLNRPLDSVNYKEFESFSLEDMLKFLGNMSGMNVVFRGETLVQLIQEDKKLFGKMAEYRNGFNAKAIADRVAEKFVPSDGSVASKPEYFSPWVQFITAPKDSTGLKRVIGGFVFPNTAAGLLAYLKSVYFFNVQIEFDFMIFSASDHVADVARTVIAPQRYFKYRGGSAGNNYKISIMDALEEQFNILQTDTFEGFSVLRVPQLADGNKAVVHKDSAKVQKSSIPTAKYNLTGENSLTGELGIQVDKDAAAVRAQAAANKTAEKAAKASKEESPYVLIHVPGATEYVKSYLLQALAHSKMLGQVAKVTGIMGAPEIVPGDYYYFDGRYKDTGYYLITGLEHNISRQGFTTELIGRLVQDPEVQPFVPQKLEKIKEKARARAKMNKTHIVRVLTRAGLDKVGGKYTTAYDTKVAKAGTVIYLGSRYGYEGWGEMTSESWNESNPMLAYTDPSDLASSPKRKSELVLGVDYIVFSVEEEAYQSLLSRHKKMVKLAAQGKSEIRLDLSERRLTEAEKRWLNDPARSRETRADLVTEESNFMNNIRGFLAPRADGASKK